MCVFYLCIFSNSYNLSTVYMSTLLQRPYKLYHKKGWKKAWRKKVVICTKSEVRCQSTVLCVWPFTMFFPTAL